MKKGALAHLAAPGAEIAVRVSPKASRNAVEATPDGLRVWVTSVPQDGKANKAVARLYELSNAIGKASGMGADMDFARREAAEALARSGVGRLRLIDPDDVAPSNVNRQLHALERRRLVSVATERERPDAGREVEFEH